MIAQGIVGQTVRAESFAYDSVKPSIERITHLVKTYGYTRDKAIALRPDAQPKAGSKGIGGIELVPVPQRLKDKVRAILDRRGLLQPD